jgi:MGT family glycosyltransferase
MSRRFLVLPVPAPGHLNPMLPVATTLVARGHEVTIAATGPFRAAVEETGATFVALDVETFDGPSVTAAGNGESPTTRLARMLTGIAEQVGPQLLALQAEFAPDALVLEGMSLWGRLLADATGTRTVGWSPSYLMRPESPVAQRMMRTTGGAPALDLDRMRALAAVYGVDPVVLPGVLLGPIADEVVAFMPRVFHPGGDIVDAGATFVGPMVERVEHDELDLGAMERTPGVYVSLGTVPDDRPDLHRAAVDALADLDLPAVVAHGGRGELSGLDVPSGVVTAPHVPQLRVLRHSRVFVTHGGMTSTMEAAATGVPMVVVPQTIEQEVTADRVGQLGLGVRLDPADVTAATLADVVRAVAEDPAYRGAAEAMAQECRAAGGVTVAADVMELAATGASRAAALRSTAA